MSERMMQFEQEVVQSFQETPFAVVPTQREAVELPGFEVSPDEVEAIALAKQGDETAFSELYRMHAPAVQRKLEVMGRNVDLAEELTQEAFLSAYRNLDRFEDIGLGMGPWLKRIAHNLYINHFRKQRRQPSYTVDADEFFKHDAADDNTEADALGSVVVSSLLEQLEHDTHRDVLESVVVNGEDQEAYANRVGIAFGTARSRLSRAKNELRDKVSLDDYLT